MPKFREEYWGCAAKSPPFAHNHQGCTHLRNWQKLLLGLMSSLILSFTGQRAVMVLPLPRGECFIFPRLHSNSCGAFGARLTALVRQTYGPGNWRLAEMTSRSRMSEYSEICVLRASLKGPKNEPGAVEPYFVGSTSMAIASFTQEYTALLMTSTFAVCTGGRFCVRDESIIPRRSYRSISESVYFWCFSSTLKDYWRLTQRFALSVTHDHSTVN